MHEMKMKIKIKNYHKKRFKNKIKSKVNLVLSYVNRTFLILDFEIGPQIFKHTVIILYIKMFFKCEEKSNSRFNLFQIGT
jgi:hypothetical protein